MASVTVSPDFRVVIPKAVRQALGLVPGTKMQVIQYLDRVEFIPLRSARSLRGLLRGIDTGVPADADRA
jgi:AbrB family looped-hinge helix DNA binding protein